jgi:DNA polymerase I-like protein with 3'-5' exonuclease and polymerase domains
MYIVDNSKTYIAIDYETHLISEESPIPKPVCLSFAYHNKSGKLVKGLINKDDKILEFLKHVLSDKQIVILAHNASFELLVTSKYYPELNKLIDQKLKYGKVICTKIYQQLIDNIQKNGINKYSLDMLVNYYYGVNISESKKDPNSWRLRYSELDEVDLDKWPKEAIKYAVDDSIWTEKIFKEHQILEFPDIQYKLTVETEYYLNKMALGGFKVDNSRVLLLEKELKANMQPMYDLLEKMNLVRFVKGKYVKATKHFKEYIENNLDKNLVHFTKKGQVSATGEHLKYYVSVAEGETRETLQAFLGIAQWEKTLSDFVNKLKKGDLIRTQYRGTVSTGRTSSHGSDSFPSVNMQQMPKEVKGTTYDVRGCFVPREGFKICSIDYSGLELASCAHRLYQLTGLSNMRNRINLGNIPTDMHSMFAARLKSMKEKKHISYEEFVKHKKENGWKEYRSYAKPINLGFPGGIGYDTIRTLMARDGIFPGFKVLEVGKYESRLLEKSSILRKKGWPTRVKRVKYDEYQLVYDEIVGLKQEFFKLYPDLENFLTNAHRKYLTGEYKPMKNEFGMWEMEPMYRYSIEGEFNRDWATYTAFCNGTLMQSPSAIGAKKAMVEVIKQYEDKHNVMRPLAFIHDEIVFEVIDDTEIMYEIIENVSEIMIDKMQEVLYSVRIAVEAEVFPYWKKSGGEYTKQFWKNIKDKQLYQSE